MFMLHLSNPWHLNYSIFMYNCFVTARVVPVAFTASRTRQIDSHIGKIIFDKVLTNAGGAYSGNTGIFTCPHDGVYVFTWTLRTQGGQGCSTHPNINGVQQISLDAHVDLGGVPSYAYSQSTMSGTFRLSKGDRVYIQTAGCTLFLPSPHNAFSGWKLWN